MKESVSGETSAKIYRDSINTVTERLFKFRDKACEKIIFSLFQAKILKFLALNASYNRNN